MAEPPPAASQFAQAEAHFKQGYIHHTQGRLDQATAHYRQALLLRPDHVDVLNNLAIALMDQGQWDEAIACYRQALQLRPDHVDAQTNLGIALMELGQWDEAAASYRQALRLQPHLGDAHNGLGTVLAKQGKLSEAQDCYEQALRHAPALADAHLNRALLWMLQGEWAKGWQEYEWRWRTKTLPPSPFRQPRWDGSPLSGRTLLVWAEQGLGDTLHFIRFVPPIQQWGGRVIFQCQRPLARLLRSSAGLENVVSQGEPLPAFDVQIPLLSLPGILGTTLANVPNATTYLRADAALVEHWRHELEAIPGFKIGIAWQGSPAFRGDRQRSIPVVHFGRLAAIPGVRLISLQKGPGTDQLRALGGKFPVIDLTGRLDEAAGPFMDTAAVMMNLDVVITSDNVIAHLAGALGALAWVALPLVPDWRWLLEREDTPWYRAMKLFRQRRLGDWDEVFERMGQGLSQVV